jgi:hypothetical protein
MNGTIFRKCCWTQNVCFEFLYNFYLKHFSLLKKIQRYIIKNIYIFLHVRYPLFLSDFSGTLMFSADFRKILKYQISCNFVPSGSRIVPCGRTTYGHRRMRGMMKLVAEFRNFANATKIFKRPDHILYMIMWPSTDKYSDNLAQNMPLCQRHDITSISTQHSNTTIQPPGVLSPMFRPHSYHWYQRSCR